MGQPGLTGSPDLVTGFGTMVLQPKSCQKHSNDTVMARALVSMDFRDFFT